MTLYLHEEDIRRQSLVQGKEEGMLEGERLTLKKNIFLILNELGEIPDVVKDKIEIETDVDLLNGWFKIAVKSASIEDFLGNM